MARIAVCEDDRALRGLLRRALEGDGHSVVATAKYHQPRREWPLVGVMTAAAIAAGILLNWASAQPHANAAAEADGPNPAEANVHLTSQQSTSHFPTT